MIDLPQTMINKATNEFCKHLNTSISAGGGQFELMMRTYCVSIFN